LRAEILNALEADKIITYEQLNALPYLDQCVNGECKQSFDNTLLLYPFLKK